MGFPLVPSSAIYDAP